MSFIQLNVDNITELVKDSLNYALEIDSQLFEKQVKKETELKIKMADTRLIEAIVAKEFAIRILKGLENVQNEQDKEEKPI